MERLILSAEGIGLVFLCCTRCFIVCYFFILFDQATGTRDETRFFLPKMIVNGVRANPMDEKQLFETKPVMDHLCLL